MFSIKHHKRLVAAMILLVVVATACSSTVEPTPQGAQAVPTSAPAADVPFDGEVQVEGIEIRILESFPVQVHVVAKGQVRDGCLRVERAVGEREGRTFQVALVAERLANVRCTDQPQPFEYSFALDVAGLKAGVCTVTVGGVSDSFELGMDNVLPQQAEGGVIKGKAKVESIEIRMLESFPVQVNVLVKGNLADGCTRIDQIEQEKDVSTNTLWVKVKTARPAEAMCDMVLVPFEEVVSLKVGGLAAGTYTVDVNGVTDTFTLTVDNAP